MSLIIGVRCKDGCLVISDKRSHIWKNGLKSYDDNFQKCIISKGCLLYNHGYNRINDVDWKLSAAKLEPDASLDIYSELANEMCFKMDKRAFYVFLSKKKMFEIQVNAGEQPELIDHLPNDRIVSGSGASHVNPNLLVDLKTKKCKKVALLLLQTFKNAHKSLIDSGGDEFCADYEIKQFKG